MLEPSKIEKRFRRLRPAGARTLEDIRVAYGHLRSALDYLRRAGCPASAKKVRSALKSTEGAHRHAQRRVTHTKD